MMIGFVAIAIGLWVIIFLLGNLAVDLWERIVKIKRNPGTKKTKKAKKEDAIEVIVEE